MGTEVQNLVDRRVAAELSGTEKVHALIRSRWGGWAGYARHRSLWPEQVKQCVYGLRPLEEIRDMICEDLEITRAEFDALIPLPE